MKRGLFISIEGIDGAGKTTLRDNIVYKLEKNYEVISIREPGGTKISEKIRDMLLDVKNEGILDRTEAILYLAARAQLVEEIIRPALDKGKIVLADRYMDSTIAYQGYGRGLELEFLNKLNSLCTNNLKPDLTLLLEIDAIEGEKRRGNFNRDRLEKEGLTFQEKVRKGYLEIAKYEPERVKVLDGRLSAEILSKKAITCIEQFMK